MTLVHFLSRLDYARTEESSPEGFQPNLKIALFSSYFPIVFIAKKIANRAFSKSFVNSKFDNLEVIPGSISIL